MVYPVVSAHPSLAFYIFDISVSSRTVSQIDLKLDLKGTYREPSGSVVECLTRDRGAGVEPNRRHCVVSLSKTH